MKIYIDVILFINFMFDFLLLLGVSMILRRNVEFYRLLLGAFVGSISILFLFLNISSLELFIFKIVVSIAMLITSFSYKNIRYTVRNLFYLYTLGMVLGGCLYFLNIQFSYKQTGLIFFHNSYSINMVVLLIFSPLILYTYIKQAKKLKNNYNRSYMVDIYLTKDLMIKCTGFLDTGNKLTDPYKKRPIILLDKRKCILDLNQFQMIPVPFKTIQGEGVLSCISIDHLEIKGYKTVYKVLLGIMEQGINIDGMDCLLNELLWEE